MLPSKSVLQFGASLTLGSSTKELFLPPSFNPRCLLGPLLIVPYSTPTLEALRTSQALPAA